MYKIILTALMKGTETMNLVCGEFGTLLDVDK